MSNQITITGTPVKSYKTQTVGNNFQKKTIVLETKDNPAYPQYIVCEVVQDRIAPVVEVLKQFKPGENLVKMFVDLRGRKYRKEGETEDKYFSSIQGWKAELVPVTTPAAQTPSEGAPTMAELEDDDDDLPF